MAHDGARVVMVEVDALSELGRGSESYLRDALLVVGIILTAFGTRGPLELLTLRVWRAHKLLLMRESGNAETPRLIQLAMRVLGAIPIVEPAVTVAVG